jgi:trimeric autotransporter adhesin
MFGSMIRILSLLILSANLLFGQGTLALSSGTAAANGSAALQLTLTSPAGAEPAGLQWTLAYSPTDVSIGAVAGASGAAAGKSLTCVSRSGSYMCVLAGLNGTLLQNGVVAVVTATIVSKVAYTIIAVTNTLGAGAMGNSLPINGVAGIVTAAAAPPATLSGLNCVPASLSTGGSSTCTVSLAAPAPVGGVVVSLSDNTAALTVPPL